jgi:hypothetical protein
MPFRFGDGIFVLIKTYVIVGVCSDIAPSPGLIFKKLCSIVHL